MKKIQGGLFVLYLLVNLLLPAKAEGAERPAARPGESSSLESFIFLVPTATFISTLPVWVAQASSYFAKEGLEVRIVAGGGPIGVLVLLNGAGQAGGLGDSAVRAALQGAPVKVVATPVKAANFYLYSRPDFTNINQLKGKSIAVASINGTPHVLAIRILRDHYGWTDPVRDVRWVSILEQRVQALQVGAIEAAMLFSPDNVQADRLGMRKHFTTTDFIAIPSGGIAVTDEYLRRNSAELKRFLTGHLKGLRRIHSDPTFTISVIEQRLKTDRDTAKAIYESQLSTFTTSDVVPESALKLNLEFNKEMAKKFARDLRPSDVFDFSIVSQVAGELDASGWKP